MALQLTLLTLLLVVVLPAYIVYKPPAFLINHVQNRHPNVLFHISTSRRLVALTIDDTPSEFTNQILDVLTANKASATFFVIGDQVAGREHVLADIVRAGSELGNHAMHDEPSISLPSAVLTAQIQAVDGSIEGAYVAANCNRTAHYFRPGSGIFSGRILNAAAKAGYKTVLGSIYPHDPFIKYWRVNAWHILSMLRPGAVIICHDRRSWTVPMLQKVVPEMKRQGYEIVTMSELLAAEKT